MEIIAIILSSIALLGAIRIAVGARNENRRLSAPYKYDDTDRRANAKDETIYIESRNHQKKIQKQKEQDEEDYCKRQALVHKLFATAAHYEQLQEEELTKKINRGKNFN